MGQRYPSAPSHDGAPESSLPVAAVDSRRAATDCLISRQPIFTPAKSVWGYDLVHGPTTEHSIAEQDATEAARQVIHTTAFAVGVNELVDGRHGCIEVSPQILINDEYIVLPAAQTALELRTPITLNHELIQACQRAREFGYTLTLRQHAAFKPDPQWLAVVDMLRVDLTRVASNQSRELIDAAAATGTRLIAEKVDTPDAFALVTELGVDLVQGFFFCKPDTVARRSVSTAHAARLRFLAEINQSPIDMGRVASTIKNDVALSSNLLRYLNSAGLGIRSRITSIHHALTMLGERPLRKWGALVGLTALNQGKPHQLLTTSLIRARFCEQFANMAGYTDCPFEHYLTGLLSSMDAILDVPMEQAIAPLGLGDEVRAALLGGQSSRLGRTLELALACERGAWGTVNTICLTTSTTHREIAKAYYDALRWASQVYQ